MRLHDLHDHAVGILHVESVLHVLLRRQAMLPQLLGHRFLVEVPDGNREMIDDA